LELVGEVLVLLVFLIEQVLEVFKLLAVVSDFIHATVQTAAVLNIGSGSLIRKLGIAVFHIENIITDTTVITFLVLEIIELFTELSNELIFLR